MRSLLWIGLLAVVGSGCGGWPWWETKKPIDPAIYAQSGTARVEQAQRQASQLANAGPEEQDRLCAGLLAQLQNEPDPLVRTEIVRGVQRCASSHAESILVAAAKDPYPFVRVTACKGLGMRKGPAASRALAETIASDLNIDVRLAATRALGDRKDPSTVSALSIALDDKDPAMQHRAMVAMKDVTGQNFGEDVDKWRQYAKSVAPVAPISPSGSGSSAIAEGPPSVHR